MNKAEALTIYKEIQTAQGKHNGRWRDELDHDDSAEEYLNTMKYWADRFKIEYDPDYKNYDDPKDCDESQLKDAMGYELKQILDKRLETIILA